MKTKKTNEELVALIQSGTDVQENMALLLEQCKGFVYSIAKKYPQSAAVGLEDLVQEGLLGVIRAAESYEEQGANFISYAIYYIKAYIVDNALKPCLNSVRIPDKMFTLIGKYRRFGAIYNTKFGVYPSGEEVIQYLEITEQQYKGLMDTLQKLATIELDSPVPGTEINSYGDIIPDETDVEESVLETVYHDECSVVLWGCLESLGYREAVVMAERYFDNMTLQEIADKHNLTNGRIGQIEQECLQLLRQMDEIKALRDDFDYQNAGLKGVGFRAWKEIGESSVERAVRKKMEFEARYEAKITKLESKLNDTLETLKIQLTECPQERRKQIEGMFNRQYDELIPYILELPDKSREMFVMAFVLGMKNSDIAKRKGVVWNAVKSGKNYAILKLNQALAV